MRMRDCGVVLAAALLAGCGGGSVFKKTLPDETRVIDGPSLALPPQFELRPPRDAEDYESVLRAQKTVEAQSLITGVSPSGVVGVSATQAADPAEQWLIDRASQQSGVVADPNVRADLMRPLTEAEKAAEETQQKKRGLLQRWFGRGGGE